MRIRRSKRVVVRLAWRVLLRKRNAQIATLCFSWRRLRCHMSPRLSMIELTGHSQLYPWVIDTPRWGLTSVGNLHASSFVLTSFPASTSMSMSYSQILASSIQLLWCNVCTTMMLASSSMGIMAMNQRGVLRNWDQLPLAAHEGVAVCC